MRLHITHHAFERMADWHSIFRPFVPKDEFLDAEGAQAVMNGLHIFVASLEKGRPSTMTERVNAEKNKKYQHKPRIYVYDRELDDLYQLVVDQRGLTLVTVTYLNDERMYSILDELRPLATFENVSAITLPYHLKPEVDKSEFSYLQTPSGRYLELIWAVPTMKPKQ